MKPTISRKFLALVALSSILSASAFAQSPGDDIPPVVVLVHVLDLSEEQISEIQELVNDRDMEIEPLAAEIRALREELSVLLEGGSPDLDLVGEIVVTAHGLEQAVGGIREAFKGSFLAVLSPDQTERVGHIHDVAVAHRAAEALVQLGLF